VRDVGEAHPTSALLIYDEVFDDGVSVLIEFAVPSDQPHTLGIYVDHNMGGLVKDVFIAGPATEVRSQLVGRGWEEVEPSCRELDLDEARARIEAALYMLDHTYNPPVDEDVSVLRALIDARLQLLPEALAPADSYVEIVAEERKQLLDDFLRSAEGQRWRGDELTEDVAATAIDFGCGYNHGGPLRWSPVVVEVFMEGWVPRKVAREDKFFVRLPEVLRDWVAYASRVRGVPARQIREVVAAVEDCAGEMLKAVGDTERWGPAKTFALAAQGAGVDLSDPEALEAFVDRYNEGLAA
jgi:hypothetical protein